MRRLLIFFFLTHLLFVAGNAKAQGINSSQASPNGGSLSFGYDFMLTDQVDSKWSLSLEFRDKQYISDFLYWGFGLGLYFPNTKSVTKDYELEVKTSQTHFTLPVFLGAGNGKGNYTIDTGPYLDWAIAGKTTVMQGRETDVTRLREYSDVKRVTFGWQFMLRMGAFHCGVRLPFTPDSSLKPVPMITLGLTI